jgi:poly-gamma-glutamate synthesis protein (capsule biosynthesis protein)
VTRAPQRSKKDGSASTETVRVGNQVGGVQDQPDYDAEAEQIRSTVEDRLPDPLPSPKAACKTMLDAAASYYRETEGKGSTPTKTVAQTRARDQQGCEENTSPAAASCVTVLLEDQAVEYPKAVDLCTRAYPAETAAAGTTAQRGSSKAEEPLELTFVGDVIFGRYRDAGYDPIPEGDYPVFADIAETLKADVVVGNLETPVIRNLPQDSPIGSRYSFGASMEHAKLLQGGGFTAMSLANNHWWDLREDGVKQTPAILGELGIEALGEASFEGPAIRVESLEAKGWRIGFVAFTTRSNAVIQEGMPAFGFIAARDVDEKVVPVLEAARADHDLLVVVVHWGDEYADVPSLVQRRAAHAMIDAGANLVIGHHPHVLQGVETHGDGLVAYSLGNFLFENINEPPRLTGVLRVKVGSDGCLERVVLHPAFIDRKPVKHPAPATGYFSRKVSARIRAVSKPLGARWDDDGADLALRIPGCKGA